MKKIILESKTYASQMAIQSIHSAIKGYKNPAFRMMIRASMPKEGNTLMRDLTSEIVSEKPLIVEIVHAKGNIKLTTLYVKKMLASFRAGNKSYSLVISND